MGGDVWRSINTMERNVRKTKNATALAGKDSWHEPRKATNLRICFWHTGTKACQGEMRWPGSLNPVGAPCASARNEDSRALRRGLAGPVGVGGVADPARNIGSIRKTNATGNDAVLPRQEQLRLRATTATGKQPSNRRWRSTQTTWMWWPGHQWRPPSG